MNYLTKKILTEEIKNSTNRLGRKLTYNIGHYLDVIFNILKSGAQWSTINSKLHYTSYHKRFIYWNKLNIFSNSYNKLLEIINSKYINRNFTKNLFIDSTMIKNIKGIDNIGPNKYDRFRNGTKINVIVNNLGIPISVKVNRSNDHDVTITEELINKSMIKIVSSKKYPVYLSGDKGYISKKIKSRLHKKGIILNTPLKKNQKKKYISKHKKVLLEKRHIVENFFSWLKNYRKIRTRYETNSNSYLGMIYFAILNISANKLEKI